MSKQHHTSFVVACPDQGAGIDPAAWRLAFHQGPTFINAYCQAAITVVDRDCGMSKQTFGNDQSRPRRFVLSECFIQIFVCVCVFAVGFVCLFHQRHISLFPFSIPPVRHIIGPTASGARGRFV